jgi:hypothetical protein
VKLPCRASRALAEHTCPPELVPHELSAYPVYYDALYYPEYHASCFDTPRSFCSWLLSSLQQHPEHCPACSLPFTGCVAFDGVSIIIENCNASISVSPAEFESSYYRHCDIFRKLVSACKLCVASSVMFRLDHFPTWFYYTDDSIVLILSSLSVSVLSECSLLLGSKLKRSSKANHVQHILHNIRVVRSEFSDLSPASVTERLSDIELPSACGRALLPLLCAHFVKIFGAQVANALRHPLPVSYAVLSSPATQIPWMSLSTEELVRRLRRLSIETLADSIRGLPLNGRPVLNSRSRTKMCNGLVVHIRARTSCLQAMGSRLLSDVWLAYFPFEPPSSVSDSGYLVSILEFEYGSSVVCRLSQEILSISDQRKLARRELKQSQVREQAQMSFDRQQQWPMRVADETVLSCLRQYYEGSNWTQPPVCAVCAQYQLDCELIDLSSVDFSALNLESLRIRDPFIITKCVVQPLSTSFSFNSPLLDGLMLDKSGVFVDDSSDARLTICSVCRAALSKPDCMPRFALANNLYRGELPFQFHDLTWVEEKICAIYCVTAHVTRLFQSSDPSQPRVFHGNTCAHDMNVVSTASVLPRTPADVNGMLSIIFVGPGKFNPAKVATVFRVRKRMIWQFLMWLKHHNRLYSSITLDLDVLSLYPEDDVLPGLSDRVVEDHELDANTVFQQETAGFCEHPAELLKRDAHAVESVPVDDADDVSVVMLEKMGVSDPESDKISGRTFTAAALRNLYSRSSSQPDLVVHRGWQAIDEYNNPDLLPGMYPTLFPCGIGGFEDKTRPTALSFQQQAQYYLNLADRSFRYHHSYLFVALNMIQRRAAHLNTFFTVHHTHFDSVARKLTRVSPHVLDSLAWRLEREHKISQLSADEKTAFSLLKNVNTIAARIPGSEASKIFVRNEIRSYFSYFGLPHLFFTFNPSAAHSPIFQVMYGNSAVDLSSRFPKLIAARERALSLAHDPVAAADFFEFSWRCCFEYLLGWDFKSNESSAVGGIFGRLRAFYGSSEYTERGSLHGHYLLWLDGATNPSDLHAKLCDESYQKRFFDFFDNIISHHLPDIEIQIDPKFDPRVERPPRPPMSLSSDEIADWDSVLLTQVKLCGEALQRHTCRAVCHKYGNEGSCRFLFPHDIVDSSYFDPDTNSVVFQCRDGTVNYFNPYILVFCRHNHDLKCILSGKAAKAAMFYISDYITKMDTYMVKTEIGFKLGKKYLLLGWYIS